MLKDLIAIMKQFDQVDDAWRKHSPLTYKIVIGTGAFMFGYWSMDFIVTIWNFMKLGI